MKISTITNAAYGITVVLTALAGTAFILSNRMASEERQAVEIRMALEDLGAQVETDAELRTDEARLFVMRGDPAHLSVFERVTEEEHRLEALAHRLGTLGGTEDEKALLEGVAVLADQLEEIETQAIEAYRSGEREAARATLFGDAHYTLHLKLLGEIGRLRKVIDTRTGLELQRAQMWSDWLGLTARILLGVTAAVFLAVLYFVLRRRVSLPLTRMAGVVKRLARQDFEVEVPDDPRHDEIGELTSAIRVFRENGLERERLDAERRRDLKMKNLILQLMYRMQACQTVEEVANVVARFCPQIFPELGGAFFIRDDPRTSLRAVASWDWPEWASTRFEQDQCWGLRRGRVHQSLRGNADVRCNHLPVEEGISTFCVPLNAHGDTIGLLSFVSLSVDVSTPEDDRAYLGMIAENVALATANLRLRERLTHLAVRDPLTGLMNRRALDEALASAALEEPEPDLTCLVVDIDHFKHFNDEFGHDAGDAVLETFATVLTDAVGTRGRCYRFGGEEFAVLLQDASSETARQVADLVRTRAATARLEHAGRILGSITVSVGIADNRDGRKGSTVRTRADLALLRAKETGRNVTVYEDIGVEKV